MKRILVLAYQLSPTKGSEYSVAWNYVTHMSKYCHLSVLYGASGDHMGDIDEMENFVKTTNLPNVTFIPVKPTNWTRGLNWLNRHGYLSYTFYFAYHFWQKQVYELAKSLTKKEHFDLIHFVGPIGYREPGFLWKLHLPYIWGPIGGVSQANMILLKKTPFFSKIKYKIRNTINGIQLRYNGTVKNALENTDVLLTATSETSVAFNKFFNKQNIYLPENALTSINGLSYHKFENVSKLHFVVVGRLEPGKTVSILLEALTQVKHNDELIVDVVGDGSSKNYLQSFANERGLTNIKWHGFLPRKEAVQIFNEAHLLIITSAFEGNPTTIWEAMSYGVPTMSFDHCGMHDIITSETGVKIPITTYEQCVADLAHEIDNLLLEPTKLKYFAEKVIKLAEQYTWEEREKKILSIYDLAMNNFQHRNCSK